MATSYAQPGLRDGRVDRVPLPHGAAQLFVACADSIQFLHKLRVVKADILEALAPSF